MIKRILISVVFLIIILFIFISLFFYNICHKKEGKLDRDIAFILWIINRSEKKSPWQSKTVPQMREEYEAFEIEIESTNKINIADNKVPSPNGEINIRIYQTKTDKIKPIILYFHGGGFATGTIGLYNELCYKLALETDITVISVNYRLAPESPYPAGLVDCYYAFKWAYRNAKKLRCDKNKVILAGDSAGGNLAAAVSLKTIDENGPPVYKNILIYPVLDADVKDTVSRKKYGEGFYLTNERIDFFENNYLPDIEMRKSPYVSMLHYAQLQNLPETIILTAEFDPLRDDGEFYAEKLKNVGVDVSLMRFDGVIHGFMNFNVKKRKIALKWIADKLNE